MNRYQAFYEGERVELQAESLLLAKLDAIAKFQGMAKFKRRKVRQSMVSVVLTEREDGTGVIHRTSEL